ncbi:MAG: ABC transporter permease [candidate division WOR-3 bacterium]|nr:ABC transporter permease [candidate division WOR-3 bacterium]
MVRQLGRYVLFTLRAFGGMGYVLRRPELVLKQVYTLGLLSLPVISFASIFLGMVTALMVAYQLEAGLPKFYVGATGGRSILIEIAPLVISLLVVARVGSNITARIGTMKVTEQIDALETMGINSVHYLALPIILASIVVVPALVIYSDFISLVAAAVSAKVIVNVPTSQYIFGLKRYATLNDVLGGLLKTPFFGLAMGSISVYYGFQTELGAEGVGKSVTASVVTSAALIMILDFIVAFWMFR